MPQYSFCQLFLFLIKPIWKQHQNFQTRNANLLTMLLSGAFVRKCAFVGDLGVTVCSPLLKPSISSVSPRNIERQLRHAYTDDTFNWKSVFETGTFGIGGVCETLVWPLAEGLQCCWWRACRSGSTTKERRSSLSWVFCRSKSESNSIALYNLEQW